jgi:hypothetical protein
VIIYGRTQQSLERRQFQFGLKQVFIVIAAFAGLVFTAVLLWRGLPDAHPAAIRNAYQSGKITLDEARQQLGNAVDNWPSHVHEQAKTHRTISTQSSTSH